MKTIFKVFFNTALLIAGLAFTAGSCTPRDRYITITGYAQGGTYAVKLNLNGNDGMIKPEPEEIRDSIDAILKNIDNSLSGYNKNSLLSRFNAGETVIPDSLFIDIYRHGHTIFEETGGIVEQIRSECGMGRLEADIISVLTPDGELSGTALLSDKDGALPKLNYNAIAQGYSCDVVAAYLYSIGVKDMMVDIGEIFCDGWNPSGQPWSLGIDKPVDGNNELGAQIQGVFRAPEGPHGIVTSGNYRKFYVRDGKKYAHSIDPRTGRPVSHNLLSATIVAPDAITADAYATYCMVIGLEESRSFLASRPDLEGCLIYDSDGAYKTWCSDGFILEEF